MSFFNDYNANDYEEPNFEPLPAAQYKVICEKIEEKETKAGTGSYLNCTFQVIEGEFKERLIFQMFNINNPNDVAQQIGRQQLASFCKAIGVPRPKSEDELLNIPFIADVKIKKDAEYGDKNEIKKFIKLEGQMQQAPVAANIPPWKKK